MKRRRKKRSLKSPAVTYQIHRKKVYKPTTHPLKVNRAVPGILSISKAQVNINRVKAVLRNVLKIRAK